MKKNCFGIGFAVFFVCILFVCACTPSKPVFVATPVPEQTTNQVVKEVTADRTADPSATPVIEEVQNDSVVTFEISEPHSFFVTAAPEPTFTPFFPEPVDFDNSPELNDENSEDSPEKCTSITIGAIGDIMVMPSQLIAAFDASKGTYDFSRSFYAVEKMFKGTDLMCGNLEGAIAGSKAGYSNGQTDSEGRIRFNAPDEFAFDLKEAGFDVITTANNHAGDCSGDGVISTIRTLKAAGLYQTGTFESEEARKQALVVDVNGFKIGILASTNVINGTVKMSRQERDTYFSRLQYSDKIQEDIDRCKAAGAEFIIMFAHWDKEYKNAPQKSTRNYAKQLLEMGVDCVLGSHPHVVQPFSYMTVTRNDGSVYTGLVAYSLGNFLSNMTGDCNNELFVRLTLSRDDNGRVVLEHSEYLPVVCYAEEVEIVSGDGKKTKQTVHQTIPCLEDISRIDAFNGMNDRKRAAIEKARASVMRICGTEVVSVMEDACWIS